MITREDLALIGVRLLALLLVVDGIAFVAYSLSSWRAAESMEDFPRKLWGFSYALAVVAPILFGAGVFALSRPIARWITPNSESPTEAPARLSTVQSVAIGTFGLFLIAMAIPRAWASYLVFEEISPPSDESTTILDDHGFVSNLISLAVGIALFTGARFWTKLFSRFRDLGWGTEGPDATPPAPPAQDATSNVPS